MTTPLRTATIMKVSVPLPTTALCEFCGHQAWVEVEHNLANGRSTLYFCGHHYAEREHRFLASATRIVDHRDALYALERTN